MKKKEVITWKAANSKRAKKGPELSSQLQHQTTAKQRRSTNAGKAGKGSRGAHVVGDRFKSEEANENWWRRQRSQRAFESANFEGTTTHHKLSSLGKKFVHFFESNHSKKNCFASNCPIVRHKSIWKITVQVRMTKKSINTEQGDREIHTCATFETLVHTFIFICFLLGRQIAYHVCSHSFERSVKETDSFKLGSFQFCSRHMVCKSLAQCPYTLHHLVALMDAENGIS